MLWDRHAVEGISLGAVDHTGMFQETFSDKEIADLKSGETWLTLTVGNWQTKPSKDHPRLSADKLVLGRIEVQPWIAE